MAVLERAGVPRHEATRALQSASSLDTRHVRAGTPIMTRVSPDSGAAEIVFQLAIDRLLRLRRSPSASWTESDERLPWTTDTVAVGAEVRSSVTDAIERSAEAFPDAVRDEVANALADILEYRVDFSRDLQKGDSIRILVERRSASNGAVQVGNILAARITVDGRRVEAVRFVGDKSRGQYFDGDGKSMRAAFLRAPLEFRRISSVFGLRKHPILGIWRAHQGTDYAANAGTRVRAIGDGTVMYAGWRGGYGRVVEIRHRNGFVTRYGHLKGFASGIRRGAQVAIASTIGFVGASGLATAPHLHFEVLVGGVHRNPSVALRSTTGGEPLAATDRSAFAELKSRLFARLDSVVNSEPFVAQGAANGGGARGDVARHVGEE
ncbi:MAG: M23 family metallopeptidase [Gemmatimonadaceae bacterium]|nr:M23 family metallopeptidase [Gemmatimonadaceae bacterium]